MSRTCPRLLLDERVNAQRERLRPLPDAELLEVLHATTL